MVAVLCEQHASSRLELIRAQTVVNDGSGESRASVATATLGRQRLFGGKQRKSLSLNAIVDIHIAVE